METKLRILAVDDSPQIRKVMQRFLKNHDLVCCSNGSDALALLKDDDGFDVIISDMDMPVMDGASLYHALHEHDPMLASRVMFVTGGGASREQQRFLQTTTRQVISKPFRVDDLNYAIADIVECS